MSVKDTNLSINKEVLFPFKKLIQNCAYTDFVYEKDQYVSVSSLSPAYILCVSGICGSFQPN